MAKTKKINGIEIASVKSVGNIRRARIAKVAADSCGVTQRASMWLIQWTPGASLSYHTASSFPIAESDYAPTGAWHGFSIAPWDGMAPDAYGETQDGTGIFGSDRYADGWREFMHASSSQVFAESYPWTSEWLVNSANQRMQRCAFGSKDKVWVLSKGPVNGDSLYISYNDPTSTNNSMYWETVPNLQSGDSSQNRIEYCGGRKYAVQANARFWINTGSLSSSVANSADWIKTTDNMGFSPSDSGNPADYCYGNTPNDPDGRFVAVGGGNVIRYSTDNGSTWSAATVDGTSVNYASVCYNAREDVFIAVANNSRIATSSDGGENWHSFTVGANNFYWIDTDGFVTVAAGKNNTLWICTGSLDTWESATVEGFNGTEDANAPFCCNVIKPL